jgi:serine/threonine protein kinase/Flp pilus assembly protein TadD
MNRIMVTAHELVRDLTQVSLNGRSSCDQTEKLAEILADYLERLERGETPDTDALVAQHPELATELRENFVKLAALHRAAVGMTDGGQMLEGLCATNFLEQRTLGDFRLIRPIGRGGMGVVYEAQQISLNRRVALKTLPLAAVLDPKQLARFRNEAQAAASLDHPHIVSVYAVGSDRGVHYYAMRFIEGQSLAEVVEQVGAASRAAPSDKFDSTDSSPARLAGPTAADTAPIAALSTLKTTRPADYFRSIARLGIQAAEALHYAHEMGVVHRDVKPSNLLLDGDGQLYVADFGLAMTQGDSNLTVTGDLLGTLRYMSPEQASGRRALVDRRTDIYSLGASLYELATLRPAYPEQDRQRLLQQIITDPPQLPSQINRTVPKDLETIVLKTMSKEPGERYTTAQDLAHDLQRFLNDEPIRAKRPSATERVAKWSRRHRTLVASAIVMLFLSVIGLSVGALLISQQRDAAQAAASDAKTQRGRAEGNLRQARAAVDKMFTKVAEELADRPHMEQLRRELLEEALQFYEGFLQESGDDPEVRYETVLVHGRVADIYHALGDYSNCLKQCEAQHRMVRALHAEFPEDARYHEELAKSYARVGEVMLRHSRLDIAERYWDMALSEWTRLAADYKTNPRYRQEIAVWYFKSTFLYHSGKKADPAAAVSRIRKGLQLLDDLERDFPNYAIDNVLRAKAHGSLGYYLGLLWRHDETEVQYRRSLALNEDSLYMRLLAHLLLMRGALQEAEKLARRAIDNDQRIIDDNPDSITPDHQREMGLNVLADILMAAERWKDAEEAASQRLEIGKRWHNRFPHDVEYRTRVAWSKYELGSVRFGAGKHQQAADNYRQAITHFQTLAEEFPNAPRYQNALAYVLSSCPAKALRNPQQAVDHAHRALELSPDNPDYKFVLAMAQYEAGDFDAAITSLEEARRQSDDRLPGDAKLVLAMALCQTGEQQRGREVYERTIDELDNKKTYSEWYKMEFRVLRADADQMFAAPQ